MIVPREYAVDFVMDSFTSHGTYSESKAFIDLQLQQMKANLEDEAQRFDFVRFCVNILKGVTKYGEHTVAHIVEECLSMGWLDALVEAMMTAQCGLPHMAYMEVAKASDRYSFSSLRRMYVPPSRTASSYR